jgi:mRNA interferase RelE/StbE
LSEFQIFETDEFQKTFRKIPATKQASIRDKLDSYVYPQLRSQPFFGKNIKRLRDYTPAIWRYRIRSYRLFYSVDKDEKIVDVLTIEDRKEAYR